MPNSCPLWFMCRYYENAGMLCVAANKYTTCEYYKRVSDWVWDTIEDYHYEEAETDE